MMKFITILSLISLQAGAQLPLIVHETFDSNRYGWLESESAEHRLAFRNGKYLMDAPKDGWMSYVSPDIDPKKDFILEASFRQIDGGDDTGLGLVWGHDGKAHMNNFVFSSRGLYQLWCSDRSLKISEGWRKTDVIRPKGQVNTLKIEHRKGQLLFSINGKQLAATRAFPWPGKYIGFVAFTKMKMEVDDFKLYHDLRINLPKEQGPPGEKENLGPSVNTIYDEVSPKISADGKTLYFGRKLSPENIGGATDKEDIWESKSTDGKTWTKSFNLGKPVNSPATNNLIAVSADNNTLLFHANDGFAFMHRTATGWSDLEDLGVRFKNQSHFLEGCLSADRKAIIFVARLNANAFSKGQRGERDIYVCVKHNDSTWSAPIHTGKVLNSPGNEYSPFLSADGRTLYFATNGRPGYGNVDIFMSKRLSDDWKQWTEPVNLGLGINTVGFDAYYTLPASGDYGYMVSNINTIGLTDIIRFKLPESVRPEPVVLVSGRVLNAKTGKPSTAIIRFDDLKTGREIAEARANPRTGEYKIALSAGKNYGFHAASPGYLSVNENLELGKLHAYAELRKDLFLVPIAIGESVRLKNVFFVQSKAELMSASYPELDRLVKIMIDNPTIEIELSGHTDSRGSPEANLQLSESRMQAVKKYLIDKGVQPQRISGKGYGGAKPIAPGTTEENRQLNRRVEFKIVKK